MIKVYTNPLMWDFLRVCASMPEDERAQLEVFVGEKYDIDRAAVGNYEVQGPKWVVKDEDEPIVIGGFQRLRQGVWQDYMLTTPAAWSPKYWFAITRICRRAMDAMFESGEAHRVQCIAPANRLAQRPEIERWYGVVGYTREATLWRYCTDGSDAVIFSRVRK
jgi:hypothetical protein